MRDVNPTAQAGFGREADRYARSRPNYPDALLEWLADSLGLGRGSIVLDLGAGTGKFTRLLIRCGACVIAAEPVAAMRAQLAAQLPGVTTLAATAQALPLAAGSIDAVVCAQAFHWFATPAAVTEIHRVLRPGGRLGLIWNVRDERVDWVHAITQLITPHEGEVPRYYSGTWRGAFRDGLFSDPELAVFPYVHGGDPESVIIERFASVSFIAAMDAPQKAQILAQLRGLIATHPALRGKHLVEFPYQTHAYCCRRLDPASR